MTNIQTKHSDQFDQAILQGLPKVLRERAILCAKERCVPVEIPVLVGLSAIGAAIGKGLVVQSGRERVTRGNLFILIGTASGIGKSEVFRDIYDPLLSFDLELSKWWQEDPAVHARAGDVLFKAQISGLRACVRKMPSASMPMFKLMQKAERSRVVCARYLNAPSLLADDATCEALGELMGRSYEAIATVSADARYQLKRLSVANSKEESFYLKGFSGDLTLSSRISRRAVTLRSPSLSALFLTQHDAYKAFLLKAVKNRSGLLPRFLHGDFRQPEYGPPQFDLRRGATVRNNFRQRVTDILEAFRFENDAIAITPSREAARYLKQLEQASKQTAAKDESIQSEILRRRAEQSWRIALCLHAAEHGNKAAIESLSLDHARCAAVIVERFTSLEN